jgi:hypothetical protein
MVARVPKYLKGTDGRIVSAARQHGRGCHRPPGVLNRTINLETKDPHCIPTRTHVIIAHTIRRATVDNPVSLNASKAVEHAPRVRIILGLIALVLEGTFAILSLAVVGFITSVFLTMRAAISVRALLLPRFGQSPRP